MTNGLSAPMLERILRAALDNGAAAWRDGHLVIVDPTWFRDSDRPWHLPTPHITTLPDVRPKTRQPRPSTHKEEVAAGEANIARRMSELREAAHATQPPETPHLTAVPSPPAKPPAPSMVYVMGGGEPDPEVKLPITRMDLSAYCAKGLPDGVPVEIHDNVLGMYGVDLPFALATVRHPVDVTIDSTVKNRDYPVLRFRRGDLYVVVGFRNRNRPSVLGVYAESRLDPDQHLVRNRTGKGGNRQRGVSIPTSLSALRTRIRDMGCRIAPIAAKDTYATVMFEGQDLGKITVNGTADRDAIRSDYDRILRRVDAIQRRTA